MFLKSFFVLSVLFSIVSQAAVVQLEPGDSIVVGSDTIQCKRDIPGLKPDLCRCIITQLTYGPDAKFEWEILLRGTTIKTGRTDFEEWLARNDCNAAAVRTPDCYRSH